MEQLKALLRSANDNKPLYDFKKNRPKKRETAILDMCITQLLKVTNSRISTAKLALGDLYLGEIDDYKKLFDEDVYKFVYKSTLG